jgi:hypothetical protein
MDRQFSSALEDHLKRLDMNDPVQKEYEISSLKAMPVISFVS